MKRFALAALLALGICASLPAQQPSLFMIAPEVQTSAALADGHFNFALTASGV